MVSGRHSPSFSIMEEDAFSKKKLLRYSTQQVPIDSISPYHHNLYGVFGYPQTNHHVGKKYQAEIPPMMSISNYCKLQKNPHSHEIHENIGKGHYFVPGFFSNPWDKKEQDIFMLGLYVFGKDFEEVKNFIGKNRTMGEILSFYYEKLCKSEKHMTWKVWWQKPEIPGRLKKPEKLESVQRVFSENIFQQPNRQKLISRIKCIVPMRCYLDVVETIWLHAETKLRSFEESVLKLMDYIELSILIEALGIGKGAEEDLTVITRSEEKSIITNVENVPNDKDCSMLTHSDIVSILSNFSLSRPRPTNLFWEAIWPRLQGRGWHYERQGTNQIMMFFAPGVEHFSERLEKGKHYFDSTDDVLEFVTLNPHIIMLPTVEVARNKEVMNLEQGTKASTEEQGGNVIGEEVVMPSGVNTNITTNSLQMFLSDEMLDALEAEEEEELKNPPIKKQKKKKNKKIAWWKRFA